MSVSMRKLATVLQAELSSGARALYSLGHDLGAKTDAGHGHSATTTSSASTRRSLGWVGT
jgi:hypothetical protein